jgi:DNA-binding PadR family transcriptional regulator
MLSVANQSIHGYELLEKVGSLVGNMVAVDKGSVYRLLRSFEQQGLLSSEWEPQSSGPHRRVYRLTPGGAHCLQAISAGLKLRAECLRDLAREADDRLTRLLRETPVEHASRATSGESTVDVGAVGNDG